jgi:hypothetical protein
MTDAELQGIAAQALNMAKRDLELDRFNFLLAAYNLCDQPPLHRMTEIEAVIIERLGANWLNSGRTKDLGFFVLRQAVDLMPPDAVVIATGVNRFQPTQRFHKLPEAQQRELMNSSHDRQHKAVAEGLLTVGDALFAIVQTPERVCQYVQDYDRHRQPVGKPQPMFFPQEHFNGRLKMFGTEKFEHEA